MLAAKTAALGIDRSFLLKNSGFTMAALEAAKQYQSHLQLIDRYGLTKMLEQYERNKQNFAFILFEKFNKLKLNIVVHLQDPAPETLEELDISKTGLEQSQKSALVSVDKLPLRLISRILQCPNDIRNITPRQFEEFIAELLSQLGFTNVILTPRSCDGGKDVIASHSINGIPLSFYFECKKYAEGNKIQLDTLRALLGTVAHDARNVNKGVLVTTSTFTKGCHDFILAESRLDGKDYNGILGWINELNKKI